MWIACIVAAIIAVSIGYTFKTITRVRCERVPDAHLWNHRVGGVLCDRCAVTCAPQPPALSTSSRALHDRAKFAGEHDHFARKALFDIRTPQSLPDDNEQHVQQQQHQHQQQRASGSWFKRRGYV